MSAAISQPVGGSINPNAASGNNWTTIAVIGGVVLLGVVIAFFTLGRKK